MYKELGFVTDEQEIEEHNTAFKLTTEYHKVMHYCPNSTA
jgi:hypothetical protein